MTKHLRILGYKVGRDHVRTLLRKMGLEAVFAKPNLTLDSLFCLEALDEAFTLYGQPEIFNTDQGSQFTSKEFTDMLLARGITISMDGKGRTFDNIFVERLWRTVKYENIYLCGYQSILETKEGLKRYFEFYNKERFHQSIDYRTPWQVYSGVEAKGLLVSG